MGGERDEPQAGGYRGHVDLRGGHLSNPGFGAGTQYSDRANRPASGSLASGSGGSGSDLGEPVGECSAVQPGGVPGGHSRGTQWWRHGLGFGSGFGAGYSGGAAAARFSAILSR